MQQTECVCVCVCVCLVMSYSLQPHGLQPTRLLCPWNFPGWNGLPFPPPGDALDPGIKPASLQSSSLAHWQVNSLLLVPPGKPHLCPPTKKNPYVEILISYVMILRSWGLWEVTKSSGQSPHKLTNPHVRICVLIKETRVLACPISTISSVQLSSVAQSCPTPYDPMNRSTPGLPVHHQLPETTQTHVHCVGDAIQPSHPLSSPSPPALNLSQHQGLFR